MGQVELKPARDDETYRILRRLSFYLLGFPPTPEQIGAFTRSLAANPNTAIASFDGKRNNVMRQSHSNCQGGMRKMMSALLSGNIRMGCLSGAGRVDVTEFFNAIYGLAFGAVTPLTVAMQHES